MNRIILVDDEMFARKGLSNLIPWDSYGYEIVGEAENGEEALDLIRQYRPDLVITDIRMPVLDGLELIRQVKEHSARAPLFIIVSGYDDFKYAQQAVRFGVQDFILKPVDEEELISTLQRISGALKRNREMNESGDRANCRSLFENLMAGSLNRQSSVQSAASLGMDGDREFCYLIAEWNDIDCALGPDAEYAEKAPEIMKTISGIIGNCGTGNELSYVHEQEQGVFAFIMSAEVLDGYSAGWRQFAETVQKAVARQSGLNISVYAGKPAAGAEQLAESAKTAHAARLCKFAYNGGPVIVCDEASPLSINHTELEQAYYAELIEGLEELDTAAVSGTIDRMFEQFHRQRFSQESVKGSITRCVLGITRIIRDMQGEEKELKMLQPVLNWDRYPVSPSGLKSLFTGFIKESSEYIARLRKGNSKGSIQKVKQYIENRYCENISLKNIAKLFYMNPVYLGQLFKKTYGMYFNEFLLQVRVREAKRLLRQTDKRVYEIAAEVGFANSDYFVSQFEKVEGKTPTEYRNALLANK